MKTLSSTDQAIISEMNNYKIDIWKNKKGKRTIKLNIKVLIWSGVAKGIRATSGVAILGHQKYKQNIEKIEYISKRIPRIIMSLCHPLH